MQRIYGLVLLPLFALVLSAQAPVEPVVPIQVSEASALVQQLGRNEFSERDAAMAKLRNLGGKARAELEEGSKSGNLETSTRCKMLLKELSGETKVEEPLREVRAVEGRSDINFKTFGGSSATSFHSTVISSEQRLEIVQRSDGSLLVVIQKLGANGAPAGEAQSYAAANKAEFEKNYPEIYAAHVQPMLAENEPSAQGGFPWPFGRRQRVKPAPIVLSAPLGPRLGVMIEAASADLCRHLELPLGTVRVTSVVPESCAAMLGVKEHDLLLLVDDTRISSSEDIRRALQREAPDPMTVTVVRKGVKQVLSGPRAR